VDWDDETEESDMGTILKLPFIQKQAAVVYTTQSSTTEEPRTRAIFCMEDWTSDPVWYRIHAKALIAMLGGDMACANPNRMFHGTGQNGVLVVPGQILETSVLKAVTDDYAAACYQAADVYRKDDRASRLGAVPTDVIAKALNKIPPRIEYRDWLRVLMAVHRMYPGATGIALVENWSPGYPGEVEQKFRSFRHDTDGGPAVGIGTLFHVAGMYRNKT